MENEEWISEKGIWNASIIASQWPHRASFQFNFEVCSIFFVIVIQKVATLSCMIGRPEKDRTGQWFLDNRYMKNGCFNQSDLGGNWTDMFYNVWKRSRGLWKAKKPCFNIFGCSTCQPLPPAGEVSNFRSMSSLCRILVHSDAYVKRAPPSWLSAPSLIQNGYLCRLSSYFFNRTQPTLQESPYFPSFLTLNQTFLSGFLPLASQLQLTGWVNISQWNLMTTWHLCHTLYHPCPTCRSYPFSLQAVRCNRIFVSFQSTPWIFRSPTWTQ